MPFLSRLIAATIVFIVCTVTFNAPRCSADETPKPAVREVQIDPISRNFMAPFMEDFIRPEAAGLKYEEVFFPNTPKETLRGWYISASGIDKQSGAEKTVLFCMGNTGNISGMLLAKNVPVVKTTDHKVGYGLYFTDPDGHRFEFFLETVHDDEEGKRVLGHYNAPSDPFDLQPL